MTGSSTSSSKEAGKSVSQKNGDFFTSNCGTRVAWLGRADPGFAAFCLTVAAASAGFLVHNFPPAKIFLGNIGSTALGFLAAACSLWGQQGRSVSVLGGIAGVFTLHRRCHSDSAAPPAAWREGLGRHRTHYYQRLVLLGWGHRRTVLAEYALMLACAGSALLAIQLPVGGQQALAFGWFMVYGLLMWGVGRLERRHVTVSTR